MRLDNLRKSPRGKATPKAVSTKMEARSEEVLGMSRILETMAGAKSPMMTKKPTQVASIKPMVQSSTANLPMGPKACKARNS